MNRMKCARPIRGTLYTVIVEEKVGNISSNLGIKKHAMILKIKLFPLFSSSCLSSMTHEMLPLPEKQLILHQHINPKHLKGIRSGLVSWEYESTSLPLFISSSSGFCVWMSFASKHGFLSFHQCLPQTVHPQTSLTLKRKFVNGWRMWKEKSVALGLCWFKRWRIKVRSLENIYWKNTTIYACFMYFPYCLVLANSETGHRARWILHTSCTTHIIFQNEELAEWSTFTVFIKPVISMVQSFQVTNSTLKS